ncbi:sulfite exporter TauE/SafE family protein [Allohahella marinimesophila]|uniref:Probable membrane transporter protein n=1 Tax=Allohahella marinimesophila TaxID=1054972 RepID=A0ABP7NZ69_9GAMM
MKIRNLDLSDTVINQEHEALGIPPIEQIPLHPVIRTAMWFAILTLTGLVAAGTAQVFGDSWNAGVTTIGNTFNDSMFWNAVLVGLLAQVVDGALGMAYGLTSTSFLLATGASPALATASVHMAEVFTTGVSGVSHAKFGNVDIRLFIRLLIPGIVGGLLGAVLVTQIDGNTLKPFITAYLLLMGVYVLSKAFRKHIATRKDEPRHVGKLALLGGFVDTYGGGGWGPVVTTTLVGTGHDPRTTIGSVNFAEFFLTLASAASLFILVDETIWHVVAGLIVGGLFAAPFAAYACKKFSTRTLLVLVGMLISGISVFNLYKALLV